ncbi:MAG: ABC transporter ATP-binding protein [Pseudomonadota bacterium]|nr:ABC transporter ATP-binding protein [Pseudomonadota bacterium]
MLVGMMLETLGVGIVIPVLTLMTNDNPASSYPALVPWLDLLGNPSHERLVVYAMLALVGVYVVKVLFLAFLTWLQADFVSWLNWDFSLRLFTGYLRQPYTVHLQRNSAELVRNAVGQVGQLGSAIQAYMLIATESLVALGILVLMLVVEPVSALVVTSVLSSAGLGFYYFTKGLTKRWGEEIQGHDKLRLQYLLEGLGATKDVKLLGREKNFIDQYQVNNLGSAKIIRSQATLNALPRLWLELLGVSGIVVTVLIMIAQNKPMESLLPALGLFTVAAFRLMPSANRLLNATQNVRFLSAAFNNVYRELCLLGEFKPLKEYSQLPLKKVLTLENIDFRYPSTEALVLKEVILSIRQGESVGFIGATGAGKSTLVDIILGLLSPASGIVKVDGVDIQTNLRGWQDNVGYVPQSIFLTDDTIRRNIAFGLSANKIDEAAVWSSLRAAQLEQFINGLPEGLDTLVGEGGVRLSGGQRQRIGIARALYHDPSVLVLDEATSALDTATENEFMEAVCALKGDKTLIIVAHRISTVERCDCLYRIQEGRIVEEGKPALLLSKKS